MLSKHNQNNSSFDILGHYQDAELESEYIKTTLLDDIK